MDDIVWGAGIQALYSVEHPGNPGAQHSFQQTITFPTLSLQRCSNRVFPLSSSSSHRTRRTSDFDILETFCAEPKSLRDTANVCSIFQLNFFRPHWIEIFQLDLVVMLMDRESKIGVTVIFIYPHCLWFSSIQIKLINKYVCCLSADLLERDAAKFIEHSGTSMRCNAT